MIVAEYGEEGDRYWRRVIVDPAAGTVTFFRCHQAAGFWTVGMDAKEYVCPLADLRWRGWSYHMGAKGGAGMGQLVEIKTPDGVARLPVAAAGYDRVLATLVRELGPPPERGWSEGLLFAVLQPLLLVAFALLVTIGIIWALGEFQPSARVVALIVVGAIGVSIGALAWFQRPRSKT